MVRNLYYAKCRDVGIKPNANQFEKFSSLFNSRFKQNELYLSGCGVGLEFVKTLVKIFSVSSLLVSCQKLDVSCNRIGDFGAEEIGKILVEPGVRLEHIDMSSIGVGASGASRLFDYLAHNNTVKVLMLGTASGDRNIIGPAGMESLSNCLAVNTTLTSLKLDANSIALRGMRSLAPGLHLNTSLRSLDLSSNGLKDIAIRLLSETFAVGGLTSLDLSRNQISNVGANHLAAALKRDNILQSLCLDFNDIEGSGGQALGLGLKSNTRLTSLSMCHNKLGSAGLAGLAEMFPIAAPTTRPSGNETERSFCIIEMLKLSNNSISNDGVNFLFNRLRDNFTLKTLDLSQNAISQNSAREIGNCLRSNCCLTSLNLSMNKLQSSGVAMLSSGLENNTTLKKLFLRDVNMKDECMGQLAVSLRSGKSLIDLDISWNDVSYSNNNMIVEIVEENKAHFESTAIPRLTKQLKQLSPLADELPKVQARISNEISMKQQTQEEIDEIKLKVAEERNDTQVQLDSIREDAENTKENLLRVEKALNEVTESLRSKERKCKEKEDSQMRLLEAVQKSREKLQEKLQGLRDRLTQQEDSETGELLEQLEQSRQRLGQAQEDREQASAKLKNLEDVQGKDAFVVSASPQPGRGGEEKSNRKELGRMKISRSPPRSPKT